jgi:hypothetical protein
MKHTKQWTRAKVDSLVNVLEKCAGDDPYACDKCKCLDKCRGAYDMLCEDIGGFLPGEEPKLGIRRKKMQVVKFKDLGERIQVQEVAEGYVIVSPTSSVYLPPKQFKRLVAEYVRLLTAPENRLAADGTED